MVKIDTIFSRVRVVNCASTIQSVFEETSVSTDTPHQLRLVGGRGGGRDFSRSNFQFNFKFKEIVSRDTEVNFS